MRLFDVAIAALIGVSAIAGIVAWGPAGPDAAAARAAADVSLRGDILGFIAARGTVWLVRASPAEFCGALARASRPAVTFSGRMGGTTCGAPPPGVGFAAVSFSLDGEEVNITAWTGGVG